MARMARALAMRLALSDTADGEAFDADVDVTPLWGVPDRSTSAPVVRSAPSPVVRAARQ